MPRADHWRVLLLAVAGLGGAACNTLPDSEAHDSDDAGFDGRFMRIAPPPPRICGGAPCTPLPASVANLGVVDCCTAADVCGASTPLLPGQCMLLDQPGGLDTNCPPVTLPGGIALLGCCRPDGLCGGLDSSHGIGCARAEDLGVRSSACNYDPSRACTQLAAVPCDGPEDCGGGQLCCGRVTGTSFDRFECRSTCDVPADGERVGEDAGLEAAALPAAWYEICHPGSACTDSQYQCSKSALLPAFLSRCFTSGTVATAAGSTAPGEVNCGARVCTAGQRCCLHPPQDPTCLPEGEPCACAAPN